MSAPSPQRLPGPALPGALRRDRVRPARPGDAAAIWHLEQQVFPRQPLTLPEIQRLLAGPGSRVLVAGAGGAVAGFLILWWRHGAATCRVIDLAVRRRSRRQGLGGRLVDAALREARRAGHLGTTLEVAAGNRPALALYRGRGFRLDRRLPHYYRRGRHALRLVRWLDGTAG